jgi:CDP-glycerol glycerophosphotransferase (TagB/SpsB family)
VDLSSSQFEISDLLVTANILITDYSSIPYEYSLLHRPIIFFTYDLDEYKRKRGVMAGFEDHLPGPMVKDTESIIELIQTDRFDLSQVEYYSEKWNQYSKGHSSQNLVSKIFLENSPETQAEGAL